jgi:hypothetical protein
LDEACSVVLPPSDDLLALDEALTRLAARLLGRFIATYEQKQFVNALVDGTLRARCSKPVGRC